MCSRVAVGLLFVCGFLQTLVARAQAQNSQNATSGTPYTLHTGTRVVLTDVTVTDMKGHPIHGLDRSAFRILDNGRPQEIATFEEHTDTEYADAAAAKESPNVQTIGFSNDYLLHPPPVSNVLFIDTTSMGLSDQVYTGDQLTKFVQELPPGEPVAICSRSGLVMLIQQNFTSDHGLLLAAVHRAVPLIWQPDAPYANDVQALQQLAAYLRDMPGHKNVLWFSGGSQLDLLPDASSLPPELDLQAIYDDLEGSRVSIYPIDVRGLTALTNRRMTWQHTRMADLAEATGGKAFYNENGPAQMARRVLNDDGNFYTITYSPHDLHHDNAWHKVKVEASWYRLSYRRGYYDDGRNLTAPAGNDRKVLLASGQTIDLPADRSEPLVFQTSLKASTAAQTNELKTPGDAEETPQPKKGETPYFVHFTLPSKAFVRRTIDGQRVVVAGTVILTMNSTGRTVGRLFRLVTLTVDEEKIVADPNGSLAFDEPINLPKGDDYLRIVVWDATTGKRGTLDLPIRVEKERTRVCQACVNGQHGGQVFVTGSSGSSPGTQKM